MAAQQRNNFECLHGDETLCRKWLRECSKACEDYERCGECKHYYIPASQNPCKSCILLVLQGKPMKKIHLEGEQTGDD